jgi:hypothetical protein
MSKLLSVLVAAVFAVSTGAAFAAKHEGAAPADKKEMKKDAKPADAKAAPEKKEKKAKKEAAPKKEEMKK